MPSAGVVVLLAAALVTVSGWFVTPASAGDDGEAWERNGSELSWAGGGRVTFDVVDGRATATSSQGSASIEVGTATRVRLTAGDGADELTVRPAVVAIGTLDVEVGDGRDLVRLVGVVASGARGGRVAVEGGDDRDLLVVTGGSGADRVAVDRRRIAGSSLGVDIDGVEDVAVVTEGGDDVVALAPDQLRSVLVDGGAGTDEVDGPADAELRCDDTSRVDGADVTLRSVERGCDDRSASPPPTNPPSPTASPTTSPSASPTASSSPSPTTSPSPSPAAAPTASASPTPAATPSSAPASAAPTSTASEAPASTGASPSSPAPRRTQTTGQGATASADSPTATRPTPAPTADATSEPAAAPTEDADGPGVPPATAAPDRPTGLADLPPVDGSPPDRGGGGGLGVPALWALGAGLALGGVAFAARPR